MTAGAKIAQLTPCGRDVEIVGPTWSTRFSVERLPDWLRMYRGLRDRVKGRYAASYAPTVVALEAVERELAALDREGAQ